MGRFIRRQALEAYDLAGICSGGKFVVSSAGEAYDARDRGPNRKFRLGRIAGHSIRSGKAWRSGEDADGCQAR